MRLNEVSNLLDVQLLLLLRFDFIVVGLNLLGCVLQSELTVYVAHHHHSGRSRSVNENDLTDD